MTVDTPATPDAHRATSTKLPVAAGAPPGRPWSSTTAASPAASVAQNADHAAGGQARAPPPLPPQPPKSPPPPLVYVPDGEVASAEEISPGRRATAPRILSGRRGGA